MRKLICPLLGGLILILMVYCGWLTSDWGSLLSCAPAILALITVVAGLTAGVVFFGSMEIEVESQPVPVLASPRIRNGSPTAPGPRVVYNERKIRRALAGVNEVPAKYSRKKVRPREVAQVFAPACTGCGLCLPFCPTDCIEFESGASWTNRLVPPVRVRYDECIGCGICVRVCEKLAWDATVMRPTAEIEREEGIVIHDSPLEMDGFPTGL